MHACSTNFGFSVEKVVLVLVWGTSARLVPAKKKERLVPASASLPTAGSALPPVGRATPLLSFSCGAGLQSESRLLLCCAPAVYMLAADAAVAAAAVFSLEHLISYCNHTKRCFGPTSRGQGRRLRHAMPNHRPGEVNPKQQLPFCCRSPCESRDCGAAVPV